MRISIDANEIITIDGKIVDGIPLPLGKMKAMPTGIKGLFYVVGYCIFSRREYKTGPIPLEGLIKFLKGDKAQDAMPTVPPGTREFLISGISPRAWEAAFKK